VEGQLASGPLRAGARVLARQGLGLENTLYFPQLPELADFAQAVPDLTIISNHLGGLMRVGPYANRDPEVLATWRRDIAAVGACPNVDMTCWLPQAEAVLAEMDGAYTPDTR